MIKDIGISTTVKALNYQTDYIPNYRDAQGQFEGILYKGGGGGIAADQPVGEMSNWWWSKAGATFLRLQRQRQERQGRRPRHRHHDREDAHRAGR